ncbi:MAG: autotransporter domain-containing protein [Chthoniobacter sp.]|nr:autotransporter domain-containing protein [Chthoniobacter sp.]
MKKSSSFHPASISPAAVLRSARPRHHILSTGIAAMMMVGLCRATAAVVGDIDSFSTNQSALTLTYPPAGTSASSSASGAGILGGERDIQINLTGGVIAGNTMSAVVSSGFFSYSQDATITGNAVIQWDGVDGSPTLNPTGLGGIDLTGGGLQNKFQLGVFFDDLPVNVTLTVYTDAGNASSVTTTLPGLIFSSTDFTFNYSSFTTLLGAGANFANVGAITLTLGSTTTAPDVVLDYFTVAPPGATHWLGQTDGNWSGTNWAVDAAGTPSATTPTSADDVTFSATGATHQNTTLDADFTIHSLTINDPAAVTISGAHTLTISGNAGTGIDVQSGASLFTLNSDLVFAGASNTITVNNAAGAVINGGISGTILGVTGLTKLGTGTLTLAGISTYTGNTDLEGGATIITGAIQNTDQFYVGYNATGVTATISGGGAVTDVSGTIGVSPTGTSNTVTVTGTGSTWTSTGDLNVGFDGSSNTLQIQNGGAVSANATKIGVDSGANDNQIVVSGLGSQLTTTNDLVVGFTGTGNSLAIDTGGHVTSLNTLIGNTSTANGSFVTVDGAGSLLTTTGTFYIGVDASDNNVTVSGGGKVNVTLDAVIGHNSTADGNELDVTGAGSNFTTSGALYVGNGGTNSTLSISYGGVVQSNLGRMGALASSGGNFVSIDGAGSLWNITGTLRVGGAASTNTLQITNGGMLQVGGNSFLGYASTSDGNVVEIDGAGSQYAANALIIGRDGTNNYVYVVNGGALSASSITLAQDAGSTGFLVIGNGGAAGTVNTPTITGGLGPVSAVVFDQTDAGYVFSPTLAGSLLVLQTGFGETILTGTNSYTGGTNIISGILRTQNSSALGLGPVNLGGGTLAVKGTLNVDSLNWGPGLVQLAPVAGDIVHVTNALTNSGGGGGFVLDTAGLTTGTYTLMTFGSQSAFAATDFFALALNSNVQLQGVFTLDPNDVQFTISGATATGPIIQNSAPIGTPTFADFTVNGPVTTGGPTENNQIRTLTFLPGGSLLIHNTLWVTQGPVILVGGSSITLDGSLSVSELQMLFGSLLNGNGNILGDLINAGLVSPGHSPGQIHVSGNYTQTSTGTLKIEIGGRDLSQHDLLSVGGTANLDGTLQLVQLNNFKLKRNKPVTFLTADEGVNGKFATVVSNFTSDTILKPTVVYHSNSVALEAVQGSFEQFALGWGLTPNQKSVARALDSATGNRKANSLFDYLDYRKLTSLPGDFDKIAPEELTSIFTIGTSLANVQSQNIQRRTDDIRSGSSGFSAAGLAVNGSGPSYSGSFNITTGVAGPNGNDEGKESKEMKTVAPTENRWGTFLSGTGEWVSVGNTDNARGYDLSSGGFTLGVDYKVCPNFAIGLMAGYTGTSADLVDRGRVYVNGGKIGIYATTFVGGWYADAAVNGGYNSYDTRRSALQGEARGDTDGGELNALFGTGYDIKKGNLTFGPTASFNYTYLGTNDFTEHGSLAPLNIHGGKGESLRTAFGFKASYDWKVGGILIKPEIRAAWQHEYGDAAYALDSNFANGAGGNFTVNGPQLGRDSALLGAGFAIQCSERCSTYFYYDGELGRKNYQSTSVTGGFRYAF